MAHQYDLKVTVSGICYRHDQCCESKKPEFIPSSSLETNMMESVIKIKVKGMVKT
jgi:hypothetical protein